MNNLIDLYLLYLLHNCSNTPLSGYMFVTKRVTHSTQSTDGRPLPNCGESPQISMTINTFLVGGPNCDELY